MEKVLWCKGPFDQRSFDFGGPLAIGPLEKVLCDKVLLLKVPLPQPGNFLENYIFIKDFQKVLSSKRRIIIGPFIKIRLALNKFKNKVFVKYPY